MPFLTPAIEQKEDCLWAVADSVGRRLSSSFFGTEVIDGNKDNPFYFRGSVNGDGMFAVIGWDQAADHFIVTGDYNPPPEPDVPASAEGLYALTFANGKSDRGRLFDWTQQSIPPPCRVIGDVSGQGP